MYIYVSIYILYSKVSGQKGLTQLRGFFKDFITFWDNQKIYILYACAFNKDKKTLFTVVQDIQKNCRTMALSLH